jgi:hypothetical protein
VTRLLCVNPRCRMLGQHRPTCKVECRGCLPRYAADGRNLCEVCTRRLAEDATIAADLHVELEQVLAKPGSPAERTTGTPDHGTELNDRAVAARTLIRHTLASWCLLVAEERGVGTPDDTVDAMAAYVALHAVWLSAHPAAGDCADEFADLAHGAPWAIAYPSGARRFPIGPCLIAECTGQIVAVLRDTDQLLPSALTCDADKEHTWTAAQWREIGRALHPGGLPGRYVTAAEAARDWRLPLGTVHRLASTEGWARSADGHRPVLYLAVDVDMTMKRRVVAT